MRCLQRIDKVSLLNTSEVWTGGTTRRYNDIEVLTGVQCRRRKTPNDKDRIVEETYLPGMSVSLVAREYGMNGSYVCTWPRLIG